MIRFERFSKTYGDHAAVAGLDLAIGAGVDATRASDAQIGDLHGSAEL